MPGVCTQTAVSRVQVVHARCAASTDDHCHGHNVPSKGTDWRKHSPDLLVLRSFREPSDAENMPASARPSAYPPASN